MNPARADVGVAEDGGTWRVQEPNRAVPFRANQTRSLPAFVAHVAQISGGNAQANAVNSTDLVWSRLVGDQEEGDSNPRIHKSS